MTGSRGAFEAPVLLLTHSGDFYTIDLVEEALRERGASCLRVDTDRFPESMSLSVESSARGLDLTLRTGGAEVDLQRVPAVWARRLWPGRISPEVDPRFAAHCARESRAMFLEALPLLERAHWVNPVPAMRRAESKLLQLKLAREVGLTLPETLVTNDPDEVRRFYGQTGRAMVTKLLGALSQTMNATGDFVYTSRVRDDDMAEIDAVRLCPQIFQPLVPKRCELRVIVVGPRVFTGAIDPTASERGAVDWRRMDARDAPPWSVAALPLDVERRLRTLIERLGLRYGAADFIVTPEGEHVFLEVNPAGEWGWLQRDLDLPIAEAIADELLEGARDGGSRP